jgi:hypothetical protein
MLYYLKWPLYGTLVCTGSRFAEDDVYYSNALSEDAIDVTEYFMIGVLTLQVFQSHLLLKDGFRS